MSDLSSIREILVLRRGGLGDLLCSIPMAKLLQKKTNAVRPLFLIEKAQHALSKYFSSTIDFEVLASGNKYFSVLKEALRRRKKVDLAICAKTSPMKLNDYFLLLLNAKKSLAYVDKNTWHGKKLENCPAFSKKNSDKRHQALKNLQLIAPEIEEIPHELFPKILLPKKPPAFKTNPSLPLIFINLSYNRKTSHPQSLYPRTLNPLFNKKKFEVVISAQEADLPQAFFLQKTLKATSFIFFSRDFEQFIQTLNLCDLCFVGDGGCMHLAAALDKKVIALFGQTSPEQWRPMSEKAKCFHHQQNAEKISAKLVLEALEQFI